jgi:two-component system OmpR family response regulator
VRLAAFVVEDNTEISESLAAALEELTSLIVVGTAASEEDARTWLQRNPEAWDIAIIDLFLAGGSGINLVELLRERNPNQKVVVFSNYTPPAVRKQCAQLGADAVFDKSTQMDALVDYCAARATHPAA